MRTISVRLDDRTDAVFRAYCEVHRINQTEALKSAIEQMAARHRATPAELALELGLIGSFRSIEGDLAESHSKRVKERLIAKRERDSMAATPSPVRSLAEAAKKKKTRP
jgi:hypothetical protein